MPPLSEVVDALMKVVLPASIATAVAFALVARLATGRGSLAAAALALAVGFVAGNHLRGAVEFRLDSERLLTPGELGRAFWDSLVPPQAEDAPIPPAPRYWIPWTAGLALLGGIAAGAVHPAAAWSIRMAFSGLAAAMAVSADLRQSLPWLVPLLFVVILVEWTVFERLGQAEMRGKEPKPDDRGQPGYSWLFPVTACATFLAASVVLLHAHSARFVDIATIMAACLGTIAVVGWLLKASTSGAAPGAAVVLPALMLSGQQDTFSEVPNASFALVALAPVTLTPLIWPRLRNSRRATALVLAAFAGVVMLGTALAVRAESLSFY